MVTVLFSEACWMSIELMVAILEGLTIMSLFDEPESAYLSKPELEKKIREKRKLMEGAAKALDFIIAAKLRDEIKGYQQKLEKLNA